MKVRLNNQTTTINDDVAKKSIIIEHEGSGYQKLVTISKPQTYYQDSIGDHWHGDYYIACIINPDICQCYNCICDRD